MSEYQYYEFQAIDRPLTDEEQATIGGISSRVELSRRKAVFTYSYRDFRGDPEKVLTQYFDAMLYMANWGSTQLIFRFPKALVDVTAIQAYCIEDFVSYAMSGDYVILNIKCYEEGGRGWFYGEGWLDSVIALREDILRQDYRVLYLAWLLAIPMIYYEELEEPLYEPPVPPGLRHLSTPLQKFTELFGIDEALIEVGAKVSGEQQGVSEDQLIAAIAGLSREECNAFLTRLVHNEMNLSLKLRRTLQKMVEQEQGFSPTSQDSRRRAEDLLEEMEQEQERLRKQRAKEQAAKRKREMEALAQEESQLWSQVYELIARKQVKAYDEAVEILKRLNDLAAFQGKKEGISGQDQPDSY